MPSKIDPGQTSASGAKPTLKEVARHLGLSTATISLVLNQSPGSQAIPAETQRRVFDAARELGYRPNYIARSLRNSRSNSIGVLVPELNEPYAAEVLSGIESHLLDAGYHYLVTSHRRLSERLQENELELFAHRAVDGVIRVGTEAEHPSSLPTVVISGHNEVEGVVNVVIDHDRAARVALGHLQELGHVKVALFEGEEGSADAKERLRTVLAAANELGIEIPQENVVQLSGETDGESGAGVLEDPYAAGLRSGEELLARGAEFTALFAFNDTSAIGAIRAFLDAGLDVPKDVSVVGFDDIQIASYHQPRLTTVRQPLREMGRAAAELLLSRLGGDEVEGGEIVFAPELIVRDSTAPREN